MASNPLGGRVNDDVGAVVDGTDKVSAGSEGVVDDEGDLVVMSNLVAGSRIK